MCHVRKIIALKSSRLVIKFCSNCEMHIVATRNRHTATLLLSNLWSRQRFSRLLCRFVLPILLSM